MEDGVEIKNLKSPAFPTALVCRSSSPARAFVVKSAGPYEAANVAPFEGYGEPPSPTVRQGLARNIPTASLQHPEGMELRRRRCPLSTRPHNQREHPKVPSELVPLDVTVGGLSLVNEDGSKQRGQGSVDLQTAGMRAFVGPTVFWPSERSETYVLRSSRPIEVLRSPHSGLSK